MLGSLRRAHCRCLITRRMRIIRWRSNKKYNECLCYHYWMHISRSYKNISSNFILTISSSSESLSKTSSLELLSCETLSLSSLKLSSFSPPFAAILDFNPRWTRNDYIARRIQWSFSRGTILKNRNSASFRLFPI